MTISVDPLAVNSYAALLARAHDDARQCGNYCRTVVPDLSPGVDGLINPICYEHVGVQQKLGAMLDHLTALLGSSGDEVAAVATRYRQVDAHTAGRLDETYPVIPRPQTRRD